MGDNDRTIKFFHTYETLERKLVPPSHPHPQPATKPQHPIPKPKTPSPPLLTPIIPRKDANQLYNYRVHAQQGMYLGDILQRSYEDVRDQVREREIERGLLGETRGNLGKELLVGRGRIGKQAQIKYYDNHKKLDKLLSKRKQANNTLLPPLDNNDPTLPMLQAAQHQKVLPCCMGFVRSSGQSNVLNLRGQKFGDKYIKAVCAGLRHTKMVDSCQFANNRITDQGFAEILSNIGHEVSKLDFSHNKISKFDPKSLSFLLQPESRLQHLNLASNLISDSAGHILFQIVLSSKHLKYLNIRKNLLTKAIGEPLSEIVLRTGCLEELYVGENRINQEGAVMVLEAFEENRTIRVFDYCMSNLGQCTPSCVKILANVLANNKILVHLDLSGNNFTPQQTQTLSESLQKNHRIYGIHYDGNQGGYIDSKGFLRLHHTSQLTTLHSIMRKNINSYDVVFRREGTCIDPVRYTNVCWVCQGWYEQVFRFVVPDPREDGKNFVYIHFDFQEFQPRLIGIGDVKVKYKTMVPPRRYRYFFTCNNTQYLDIMPPCGTNKSINTQKSPNPNPNEPIQQTLQLPLTYTYEINHQLTTFTVEQVSTRMGKPRKIVNDWDEIVVTVVPRQEGLANKKEKKVWSYKDSFWAKEWKLEDQMLTRNCFEKDWKCSKLPNFIKNPTQQQKVKQLLHKNYKLIKQLYRHYSSWSPFNSDIWAVSNNAFTQFCHLAKIICKETPLTIIDLTFITTNSISGGDYKGNSLVPERGLVRFQFMEGLVRLAEEKFKKNGLADSVIDSVGAMVRDHLQPLAGNSICSSEQWRLNTYFCQQNDMLVKKYRPIFTQLYRKNSRLKVKPGNKPFMCLTQFKSIIQKINSLATPLLERDIFLGYNCSMMTQVDQLENERFMRMSEIEFIEAVARCASFLPDCCRVEDVFEEGGTPFYGKFQWIIHELKGLCSEEVKNNFMSRTSLFNKSEQQ